MGENRVVIVDPKEYTKYEIARIIGARALQISMGAPILIKLKDTNKSFIEIAELELKKGILPITIVRILPEKI